MIFFGAGRSLSSRLNLTSQLGSYHVVEIWDHHPKTDAVIFRGRRIKVTQPHALGQRLPIYILPVRYEKEIREQLVREDGIDEDDIFAWDVLLEGVRQKILRSCQSSLDPQLQACADFIKHRRGLGAFFGDFQDAYTEERMQVPVSFDEVSGLWFTDWHGRRLYMKRGATEQEAEGYFRSIKMEQDDQSPHHYPVDFEQFPVDVVIDCGAAEGFFALDAVGKAEKIILFECDDDWLYALRHTFAEIKCAESEIIVVPKFVGNAESDVQTTVDALGISGKRLLVKLDIEGAEMEALHGMENTLARCPSVRVLACSYHRHGDAEKISAFLLDRHFIVRFSDGYMWFQDAQQPIMAELRHGLVIAEREQRKRVYLWGAGRKLSEAYAALRPEACIVSGVIDSHAEYCKPFRCHEVQFPSVLKDTDFDAVIVTAKQWDGIARDYAAMGLPGEKLICFWKTGDSTLPLFRQEYVRSQRLADECRCWKLRALNAPFEYGKESVQVRNSEKLLQQILKEHASLSRFGDGEFSIMLHEERPWFQKPDLKLAERLQSVLHGNVPNLLLAIADNYGNLDKYTEDGATAIRDYQLENHHRERILEMLDESRDYYDAYVTRPYLIYRDKRWSEQIFDLWKQVFAGRDILLVEGRFSRFGYGSNLLAGAASVRRILAPEKDAFQQYDRILESIRQHAGATDLVLISLGPTATVLAADVAKSGIQAIDVGQLDNEYDWYRMGAERRVLIPGKMTAEVQRGRGVVIEKDAEFESSVVDRCFQEEPGV